MEMIEKALALKEIADHYGDHLQILKLIEEMGEATAAASEVLQVIGYHEYGGKDIDVADRIDSLVKEMGDVWNVTQQLVYLFGMEEFFEDNRRAGIEKTLKRIREERMEDAENGADIE